MCLQLKYSEALLFKRKANDLVAKANQAAANSECDPLLRSTPQLSKIASAVTSMQIQHGFLIEEALIFAIHQLRHWYAKKEPVPVGNQELEVDCIAHNSKSNLLYVFECKRGNSSGYDGRAIDRRLELIENHASSFASSKGWGTPSIKVFILSFYGSKWNSKYPIFTRDDIATIFEPCVLIFFKVYLTYIRKLAMRQLEETFDGIDFSVFSDTRVTEHSQHSYARPDVDWIKDKSFRDDWFADEKFENPEFDIFEKIRDSEIDSKSFIVFEVDKEGKLKIDISEGPSQNIGPDL